MKKLVSMLLCLCLVLSLTAFAAAEGYTAGTYEGKGAGRNGDIVNKEGKRYVNETERRDVLAAAALKQTDGIFYIISSTQNNDLDENGYNSYGLHIDDLVAAGEVYRADTLEELAQQLGMDPAVLMESVKKFNEAVSSGYDP